MVFLRPTMFFLNIISIVVFLYMLYSHKGSMRQFSKIYDARYLSKMNLSIRIIVRFFSLVGIVFSMSFSLANANLIMESYISQKDNVKQTVVIALDVSQSMYVQDFKDSSRIEKAVQFILSFIDRQKKGTEYILFVFTDTPVLLSPKTSDKYFIKNILDGIKKVSYIQGPSDFKNVFSVLFSKKDIFFEKQNSPVRETTFLFVSDGESHTTVSMRKMKSVFSLNDITLVVSVGTREGAPVRSLAVMSHAQPEFMEKIANATEGKFLSIENDVVIKDAVLQTLDVNEINEYTDISFIGTIGAFLFLFIYFLTILL